MGPAAQVLPASVLGYCHLNAGLLHRFLCGLLILIWPAPEPVLGPNALGMVPWVAPPLRKGRISVPAVLRRAGAPPPEAASTPLGFAGFSGMGTGRLGIRPAAVRKPQLPFRSLLQTLEHFIKLLTVEGPT